jgi:hypothetical protein
MAICTGRRSRSRLEHFLRTEAKFDTIGELQAQMAEDCARARSCSVVARRQQRRNFHARRKDAKSALAASRSNRHFERAARPLKRLRRRARLLRLCVLS